MTSGRAKKLDEHLNKLNKYFEVVSSKKQQQRNEILGNERSSGALKIGSLIPRNPTEFGSQKFDDRPKNGGVNKRLRTSVAETRVRNCTFSFCAPSICCFQDFIPYSMKNLSASAATLSWP